VAGLSLLRNAELGPFSAQELGILLPLQGLMQLAARTLVPRGAEKLTQLTPRERQIALLLREGASNKQLARHLEVGLPTVKTHLLNLFRKAGVSNRTELVAALFL
jgi:DNA-binding CsgD family transcriptional regulator